MNKRVKFAIVAVIIVIAVVAGVTAWYLTQPASVSTPIIVGMYGPLTGGTAISGQDMQAGAQIAIDQINANGGVLGRNLTLVSEDDQGSATSGVTAVQRLITVDGVDIIVGGFSSTVTNAVMETVAQYNVTVINPASGSITLRQKMVSDPQKYRHQFFLICNSSASTGEYYLFIKYELDQGLIVPNTKTFVIVAEDSDFGRDHARYLTQNMASLGWNCTLTEFVPPTTADFTSLILRIKALNPDLVDVAVNGAPTVAFQTQFKDAGLKVPLLNQGGWIYGQFLHVAGSSAEGAIGFAEIANITTDQQAFYRLFQTRYGRVPTEHALTEYTGVQLAAQAIKNAGSLDKEKIYEAVAAIQLPSPPSLILKKIEFNQLTHEPIVTPDLFNYVVMQVQNGTWVSVFPVAYAQATYAPPK
jgi:branched-chain amino acid transport system substrate-binding protein